MDDVLSCVYLLKIFRLVTNRDSAAQSGAIVRHGLLSATQLARVHWDEISWRSEKSERFERKGVYDVVQRGLHEGLSRRGTDLDVAYAGRERPVARDEHIPVLGRAVSDEVVGERRFTQTPSVPTVLGRLKSGTASIMAAGMERTVKAASST
ncbi:hypothetical protein E4U13_002704 [Claviceps humidiphila]|uniref:Uncharacterized protein n=1 Tax=Claviceps humidiphila TaxID=1294629 RepID=A0A9P7Q8N1_9HYPO|nr:hypothetical protein E4U13_002704 [Claviceps humidiphila]